MSAVRQLFLCKNPRFLKVIGRLQSPFVCRLLLREPYSSGQKIAEKCRIYCFMELTNTEKYGMFLIEHDFGKRAMPEWKMK